MLQLKEGKKKNEAFYNPSERIWQDKVLNLFGV